MKKVFGILVIVITIAYVYFISYADGYGTSVEYIGSGIEEYTVTVPAKMSPNGYGEVVVEGEWASNRVVNVTADKDVKLVNSINIFNKKKLDVNFDEISANGNNLKSKKISASILVSDLDEEVLFGEWNGTFNYSVEIVDDPYDEIYYERTYSNTFLIDGLPRKIPEHLVVYKNFSGLFVYSDGTYDTSLPGSITFENNYIYMDDMVGVISDDKTQVSMIEPNSGMTLGIWELAQINDTLFEPFKVVNDINVLSENTTIDIEEPINVKFIRFSDDYLFPSELINSKTICIDGSTTYDFFNSDITYLYGEDAYVVGDMEDFVGIFLLSVKYPIFAFDIFFSQPGLYYVFINDFVADSIHVLEPEEEPYSLEWNTLEVKNNKKVIYNEKEYVKVLSDASDIGFYTSNQMYLTIDANILSFGSTRWSTNGKIYDISYKYGSNNNIIVVTEPGEWNGTVFDEVGVYAFNFGKFNKDYTITLGYKRFPVMKNDILRLENYSYGNKKYKFRMTWYDFYYGVEYFDGSMDIYGKLMFLEDGSVGVASNDGKSIKFYKYLSSSWIAEEDDDVIFTLDEE